jgi:uncharacterized membrane protein
MMKENSMLREAARSQLKGSWLPAVGVTFIYCVFSSVSSMLFGIGLVIISGPLMLGYYGYFIRKIRGEPAAVNNLFDGFALFGRSFLLFLLQNIFVFLWTMLLIIPGIVKGLSYSMAFFILRDEPSINALDAINASKKMMNGYKAKLFCLYLSFIGWGFLAIFTLGVGYLWLMPYMSLSLANFYEDLKQNGEAATEPASPPPAAE